MHSSAVPMAGVGRGPARREPSIEPCAGAASPGPRQTPNSNGPWPDTRAIFANSYWRLRALGIESYFSRLYTLEGKDAIHISPDSSWIDPPAGFVTVVPRDERKPNPRLLVDICQHENAEPKSTYYLGD